MVNVASHPSSDAKRILNGFVIPAGQTADEDLQMALDTIFKDPNVGPFFCKALIQRLVTSNPSPGYIYRVAFAFNDNGEGVRGIWGRWCGRFFWITTHVVRPTLTKVLGIFANQLYA